MPITIGIPFYNAEEFLLDAIRSVFAQTYEDWELILMDDGSTDGSLEIAKAVKDSRVRVYSDGKNKKLATRLNEIVQLAKYDIIARMDADDLMSPERIEKQMLILNKNPKIDLVSTGLFSISNDMKPKGMRWHHSTNILFNDLLFKNGCGVVHAAIVGRKSWFMRNPYDVTLKIAQDYDLWLRASFKKDFNIHLIQEPLYYYREEGSITVNKMLAAYQNERIMYRKYAGSFAVILNLKSYLKSFVVRLLNVFNYFHVLIERRSRQTINSEMKKLFSEELYQIKQTKILGLD